MWGEHYNFDKPKPVFSAVIDMLFLDHTLIFLFTGEQCVSVCGVLLLNHVGFFFKGAVSAGGDVPVYGFAAGPSRSVESAGTQSVCSGHHGCGMGKNSYIYCTVGQLIDFIDGVTQMWQQQQRWASCKINKKINTNNLYITKCYALQNI